MGKPLTLAPRSRHATPTYKVSLSSESYDEPDHHPNDQAPESEESGADDRQIRRGRRPTVDAAGRAPLQAPCPESEESGADDRQIRRGRKPTVDAAGRAPLQAPCSESEESGADDRQISKGRKPAVAAAYRQPIQPPRSFHTQRAQSRP